VAALQGGAFVVHFTNREACHFSFPPDSGHDPRWSNTIGMSLEDYNITILTMGGGERARLDAPVRSDVVIGISSRAQIPHVFVFDRDERDEGEISAVKATLGVRVHFLERRELENYLLVPRAILAALRKKYAGRAEFSREARPKRRNLSKVR
jgi:hypothetical protein